VNSVVDGQLSGSQSTRYGYDQVGNLLTNILPNAVTNLYQYDSLNRLKNLTAKAGTALLGSFAYGLGSAGNRTSLTETVNSTGRNYAWSYDKLYRLTNENISASPGGSISYLYDSAGNRTSRSSSVSSVPTTTYSYDPNDRLNSDIYDANGNTTNSAGNSYGYDFENRLAYYNILGAIIAYDGDGNRVSEQVGATTTFYLVDSHNPSGYPQVLEELQPVNQGPTNLSCAYTYGLSLISQRQPGVSTNFFVYDGHGSTRLLTDMSGTNVVNAFAYDAFGNMIASNTAPQTGHLYCGEQVDPNFGLYYLRARYMSPATGRFWTRDTYEGDREDPLSLHKYLYVRDDPVNRIDPSGNDDIADVLAVISIGGILDSIGAVASAQEVSAPVTSSDSWNVREHDIDLNQPMVSVLAGAVADPHGFWVTYKPSPADSRDNKVLLYQVISASGLSGFSPRVDANTATAPTTGSPMPPRMFPLADTPTSYQDSPTYQSTGFFGISTFHLTAVAVRRTKDQRGGDRLLSTYSFDFDNKTRTITTPNTGYTGDYDAAMKTWWGN
jgi:RHS repeat-associated protein